MPLHCKCLDGVNACAELQKQHTEMERSLEAFCKEEAARLQELCMVRCVWPTSNHRGMFGTVYPYMQCSTD